MKMLAFVIRLNDKSAKCDLSTYLASLIVVKSKAFQLALNHQIQIGVGSWLSGMMPKSR
jgi:hypothetical protein